MPRTETKSNHLLGIRLEGGQYAPGDTIIGCVFRKAHVVSPHAAVKISLHGRAKSKMVVRRGNSHSTYRGRFNFTKMAGISEVIFEGPLHVPIQGPEQIWPFALTLPSHADPRILAPGVAQEESYISLDPAQVATQTLPPTFTLEYRGFNTNMEGFVEYFLQAELRADQRGSVDDNQAALPVQVNAPNLDPPIADFRLKASRHSRAVSTYHLVPGMENAELSFSQKTKQRLGSSKVPTFMFNVQVQTPTVLQLANPNPIPILARAVPDWDRCTEVLKGVPQKVRLTKFSINIEARTEVRCEGTFSPHHESKEMELDLQVQRSIDALKDPIYLPCTDEWPAVNIGEMINLRVGYRGGPGQGRFQLALYPTFTTYNIRHTHRLTWEMGVEISGEESKMSGMYPITVLPPSDERGRRSAPADAPGPAFGSTGRMESWMQPPDEDQAPPTFAEVQQQDVMSQKK